MNPDNYQASNIAGRAMGYDFTIEYDESQDCILLSVGINGAWHNTYLRTVGEALRELARHIGEG